MLTSTSAGSWASDVAKIGAILLCILLASCSATPYEAPLADSTPSAKSLKKLPRKQGERVAVTIYEFRSSLPNVSSHTATDMFKTALVQSGQFTVVEPQRLLEGVVKEKQLQQSGFAARNTSLKAPC
jgi:curli biogenesis system outer membrane secretion channel CsgG